jgi:hypothetical protein
MHAHSRKRYTVGKEGPQSLRFFRTQCFLKLNVSFDHDASFNYIPVYRNVFHFCSKSHLWADQSEKSFYFLVPTTYVYGTKFCLFYSTFNFYQVSSSISVIKMQDVLSPCQPVHSKLICPRVQVGNYSILVIMNNSVLSHCLSLGSKLFVYVP